ncbi:MAG: aconitate hydratase AcnA [Fimbriimonadia bacterium]
MNNSFGARASVRLGDDSFTIYRLDVLERQGLRLARLPYSLRVLLENLLRREDGVTVTPEHVMALANWDPTAEPSQEIAFSPARVVLQDFTGVPCLVDLAAMRDAVAEMGGDASRVNPQQPVELVVDHSVQVDAFGTPEANRLNVAKEFERNSERYAFLKWGQSAFRNFRVVPPNTGIVHQVNLEYLARVVFVQDEDGEKLAYPDTLVGTDSHTTMINGLGVLGWGVGGIEAEAAMLGQPVSILVPQVVGVRVTGVLPEGVTATDLVLTVTQMLRTHGVVGKFVEFFGAGLESLPVADRATISNMCPEYGATCAMFPVDDETLRYLRQTGRPPDFVSRIEGYAKEQGLFRERGTPEPEFTAVLELDLSKVESSVAGPRRPQDRVPLSRVAHSFSKALPDLRGPNGREHAGKGTLKHGNVVIAAITSCTNTSNPAVMLAAGLLAKKAVQRGLTRRPWVKTSLAPGSRVVTTYLERAGLTPYLEQLGFHTVGYGCTTCIGNSGPLPEEVSREIEENGLVVCAVLSGNRNFEGRVHSEVRANYLMSPPLVVAYAIAGRIDIDLTTEPLTLDASGVPVYLRDLWPSNAEIASAVEHCIGSEMFENNYKDVFRGDENWESINITPAERFQWQPDSTYVRRPPYFDGMPVDAPETVDDIRGARVLAYLGDSITTDHISPAGSIKKDSPAGRYLLEHGVEWQDFNSYGSRRGNHEVMVRGTFANVRIRNKLTPGAEGGVTTYLPTGDVMSIYDAAVRYQQDGTSLIVLAGKEYGSGSSRDWAAKGPYLQGVRAVIAESFERIHRSNLIGMGIIPLQFLPGESAESLGLTGTEHFDVLGLSDAVASGFAGGRRLQVVAQEGTRWQRFDVEARIDTPRELDYYRHGGILQFVVRSLLQSQG